MSHTHSTSTSSNFQLIFDNALKVYEKQTKMDILTHPLADRFKACDSACSILTVLQDQVQEFNESQCNNTKLLDTTVKVLHAIPETLGKGVGSVFSPAKVIFIGFGVLLSTANDVGTNQDTLFETLERLNAFFQRLEIYTEVALDHKMVDTVLNIMTEVLNIIGIATNEIKQGRMKKHLKKLFGNKTGIEHALKRLDILTQKEAQMAAAQVLKATQAVDDTGRMRGVTDAALNGDNRVAGIGDQLEVQGVDDNVTVAMNDVKKATVAMQQEADIIDQAKRNQVREDLYRWLSPPDPSTNHNIACNAHHKGTATWFLEGKTYKEWKSTGSESLLWIHGKPGSGKSILCSAIIQDIEAMCGASQALMGYFYFDFRDIDKQHWHDLVSSLLIQLSVQSDPRCDILSYLHSNPDSGARQHDDILKLCLEEMLTLPDQRPIYLIIDALDACSNTSKIPSHRIRVLQLVKDLIDLHLPNLHICVTSHPEVDIRDVLEPLTSHRFSLHDQSGQKQDIADYVRSVVYSESEPIMRRWRSEDKELVIETLSERADGMFRWIFCQLEVLRDCLPSSVRRTLKELPESLDETYERILKEIKKPNRDLARRVLQCLVVAARPLRVAELAEVLAVDFGDAEGIPRLNSDWRWDDQEQALLIACSSLIAIVEPSDNGSRVEAASGGSRIVQFSHFSVKEFLTSPRLATASGEISKYHIDLEPAHTVLGQACLGILLQIRYDVEGCMPEDHPLARYAAEHWTTHVQFGGVSSRLHKGMEYLFDANRSHFKVWLTLYDIDTEPNHDSTFYEFALHRKSLATPLYYAALCGFHDLVEHLITKHPQDVNAYGGYYVRPLVAALAGEHFQTADLLRHNGANQDVRGVYGRNPLHAATFSGNVEMIRRLVEYDPANINVRDRIGWTPLLWASRSPHFNDGSVLRLLLGHGADINLQNQIGWTPLHLASFNGALEVVRLLLEHGADVVAKDNKGKTALQVAAGRRHNKVVKLLREHGAK